MRRNRLGRNSLRRGGEGTVTSGVTQIVAGTNITISPPSGTGVVTINATGDITGAVANDAGIVLTNAGGPIIGIGQVIAAEWPIANMRIYAVDFVNGLDTNAGFADAAGTSAANYATACAAAGAVAKKTIAGLAAIWPRVGNGRLAEIILANGGVNTEQAYTDALSIAVNGSIGYAPNAPFIRATGTNTTAGAVAFAGTTNDFDYQGAITSTGCNAPGYNPTGAPTTSVIQCLKVGGGAAAIPVEPAAPLGWRIRFDNATTTVALRNVCRSIAQVSGTDTILPQTVLPAVPVAADIFYLEQAGVTIPATALAQMGHGTLPSTAHIIGIRCTGALSQTNCALRWTLCGCTSFDASGQSSFSTRQTVAHPVLGTRTVGGGLRSEGAVTAAFISPAVINNAGLVSVGSTSYSNVSQLTWGAGSYAGAGLSAIGCQLGGGNTAQNNKAIGTNGGVGTPRVVGRIQIAGSNVLIGAVVITGAGANPAIDVRGGNNFIVIDGGGVPSGATGNTLCGLGLQAATGSTVILLVTPTVTGVADVQLSGGQALTWAQAIATGIVDSGGNKILGTAGVTAQAITQFAGSVIGAVGAVVSYLADTGPVAANQIVPLRRPTSLRLATRLRVTNLVNTSANATTVTLYKNGVATTMLVTIPAATAANTKFSDLAHPILFLDGDDYDLRMDDAADVAGVVSVSAALEWAV